LDESRLTEKQRKWLEASKKIGPGPMTKSERQTLERLYAEMLPREQQDLYNHIRESYAKADTEQVPEEDPISIMEQRAWNEPSPGLMKAFSRPQKARPRKTE